MWWWWWRKGCFHSVKIFLWTTYQTRATVHARAEVEVKRRPPASCMMGVASNPSHALCLPPLSHVAEVDLERGGEPAVCSRELRHDLSEGRLSLHGPAETLVDLSSIFGFVLALIKSLVPLHHLVKRINLLLQHLFLLVHAVHLTQHFVFLPLELANACPGFIHADAEVLLLGVPLFDLLVVLADLRIHVTDSLRQVCDGSLEVTLASSLALRLLDLPPCADRVSLEDRSLHLHHQLLLSPHELGISQLHPMDLPLHPLDHLRSIVLVSKRGLHLLLKFDFSLEHHDHPLLLNQIQLDLLLLLYCTLDLTLDADRALLEVLEGVDEVSLEREVVSLQRREVLLVEADELIQLRHVRVHPCDARL
mmetsp:Transcript_12015/g.41674  ORF Transcript_12015/g.41674 Transcript_12015/m.41674 type:complete len:364 (-) Transcript_12015:2023-3114(-)